MIKIEKEYVPLHLYNFVTMKNFLFITVCLLCKSLCFGNMISENTGLLWKITGNKLENPSYLFGTWHSMPYQFLDSVPGFYSAFNIATVYLGEIDPTTKPNRLQFAKREMPQDTSYMDLLNKTDFDFLDSVVNKYLNASADLINYRPFPLGYILSMTILTQKMIQTDTTVKFIFQGGSLDGYLWMTAQKKGIPTFALETYSDRYRWGILDLSVYGAYDEKLEDQVQKLIVDIKALVSDSLDVQSGIDLIYAYCEQNLAKFEYIYSKDLNEKIILNEKTIKIEEATGKNRNVFWMEKISPWLINNPNSTLFIAVGATHLIGEYGLISLLRKEGYTVEPVTCNDEN